MELRSSDCFPRGSISCWAWHWTLEKKGQELTYPSSYSDVCTAYRNVRASAKIASPNVPSPSPPPPQQILNDTSLAATVLANGDRHLFFQDPRGVIRRVIRTASATQWNLDQMNIPILDARSATPMAVTSRKFPDDSEEVLEH